MRKSKAFQRGFAAGHLAALQTERPDTGYFWMTRTLLINYMKNGYNLAKADIIETILRDGLTGFLTPTDAAERIIKLIEEQKPSKDA